MNERELDYNDIVWQGGIDIVSAIDSQLDHLNDEAPLNENDDSLLDLHGLRERSTEKIKELLIAEGIDIDKLNKTINKALFNSEVITYYSYKD